MGYLFSSVARTSDSDSCWTAHLIVNLVISLSLLELKEELLSSSPSLRCFESARDRNILVACVQRRHLLGVTETKSPSGRGVSIPKKGSSWYNGGLGNSLKTRVENTFQLNHITIINKTMADGMDKGLMALMGIEDDTINLQSTNLSCSASGFSSDAVISDMDEDSPTLRQSLSFASPKGPLSTNSRPRQLDLSDVSKSPISKTTSPNPSRSKPLKASSSSLFNRTSSPVDDSSEWHSSAGVLRKRAPSRRSNEKADGPGDFMFSPTLKPKKNIGKPRTPYSAGNTHQDVVPSATRLLSISPPPYPGNLSDRKKSPSSFDMRFCANPLPHDHSDSEVSSFDESISYPSVHDAQRVSLNYSVPSDEALNADLISEFGSGPKSLTLAELVASTSSIGDHKWDRDSDQEDIHEPSMTTKPFRLSKKRDLQETKEREHLLRIGGTNLKSTVNKKLTLQNLMKETLAKQ